MKKIFTVPFVFTLAVLLSALIFFGHDNLAPEAEQNGRETDENEKLNEFIRLRWMHEFNMIKDPVLNQVPRNIVDKELVQAMAIPQKQYNNNPLAREMNLNNYLAAGPNNIGGRTRAISFDKR